MSVTRFIVPFGRDGAADRAARAFASSFRAFASASSDAGLAIENLPGEGGLAGVTRANALAEAGESVLLLATPTTHVLLPARLGASAAPHAAFVPLLGLGSAPNMLLVSPALAVRNVEELVALARREPLVYASAGLGQTIHVCTALFCAQAGIAMTHRPYDQGSAAAYDDLVRGNVHVYFDNVLACADHVAYGHAVALAVSARARHASLPHVPTLRQCGYEHALDVWLAVFGAHMERDAGRIGAMASSPGLRRELARLGLSGGPQAATELAREVEGSVSSWRAALAAITR